MLDYFKRLFSYNHWANSLLIEHLEKLPDLPPKALDRMSHVVLVEYLWRARIEGKTFGEDSSRARPLEEIARLSQGSHTLWMAWLERLGPDDLSGQRSYTMMDGTPMNSVVSDVLAHVVNHGTHHRGQIVASIRDSGTKPPALDYLYFTRERP